MTLRPGVCGRSASVRRASTRRRADGRSKKLLGRYCMAMDYSVVEVTA